MAEAGGIFEIIVSSENLKLAREALKLVRELSEVAQEGCKVSREVRKAVNALEKELGPDLKKKVKIALVIGVSLGALWVAYKKLQPPIRHAVKEAIRDENNEQDNPTIRPGSLHVG